MQRLILILTLTAITPVIAQDAYFHFNKGMGQLAYGNLDNAVQAFTKAIESKSDYANALANRGLCYHKLKKLDLAIADYLKSETFMKGISSYNLACAYSLQGKPDEAFKWLTACQKSDFKQSKANLEADTDFENIRSDKRWKTMVDTDWSTPYDKAIQEIDNKWNASDVQGSIDQCGKAASLAPTKSKPILTRAFIYTTRQEWDKALADYDKAIQINTKDWEPYAGKGSALYKQRQYADAIAAYQQAMTLNPEFKPYSEIAMIHFAMDQKREAIADLKNFLEFYPADHFSVYFCGFIHYMLQEDASAMSYANQAIELSNETPEYHLLKANILLATKDFNDAIVEYSTVLQLNDKSGEAYYKRGIAKAERFAKTNNKQDKVDFCSDMEKAADLEYEGAAQYLRELCN
jgi:tetratricopeptide (TPR) repeat protein